MHRPRTAQQPELPASQAAVLDWQINPRVADSVVKCPGNVRAPRVAAPDLEPDADFERVVRKCVRENPDTIGLLARG